MPQQDPRRRSSTQYAETLSPENPPIAVVRAPVRSAALATFLGGILLVFLLFGAVLLFWEVTDRSGSNERTDPAAVGTSGEPRSKDAPGGVDPDPSHGSTRGELEYRGVDEPKQGPMPGLTDEKKDTKQRR